ncbi:MAG: hypothetical protein KAJ32_06950 [Gammaproteobacteria bacterium]|nr:hypothetical protein [Gammaproteobacteria bacterium]
MFNSHKKQRDVLEKFRIKAHLRSYVKDPVIIDTALLKEAISKLKKLPYEHKDPTDSAAIELILEAHRLGYFKYEDLTDAGCEIVRHGRYRGHQQLAGKRTFHGQTLRNCYLMKTA